METKVIVQCIPSINSCTNSIIVIRATEAPDGERDSRFKSFEQESLKAEGHVGCEVKLTVGSFIHPFAKERVKSTCPEDGSTIRRPIVRSGLEMLEGEGHILCMHDLLIVGKSRRSKTVARP